MLTVAATSVLFAETFLYGESNQNEKSTLGACESFRITASW